MGLRQEWWCAVLLYGVACTNMICMEKTSEGNLTSTSKACKTTSRYTRGILATMPAAKHWGGSVMFCGCVAASGTGKITQVDGRMDSSKYQQVLYANMTQSVKNMKLKEAGFYNRTMILNILQNLP